MHLLASRLLHSLDLAAVSKTSHAGTVPLVIVAAVLFVAAVVVRKIIKLAIVVVLAAIVALAVAGWRAGLFG
ncbi:MAG: hypothetical protein QOE76_3480 [Frankiales bacterium]|nr:hypothetical protein [Frankiales bacterium]MDX6245757.1 hypothetical protein [Frankiales bacterium]